MNNRNIQIFQDTVMRLLHRGAQKNLQNLIEKSHAADLAQVIHLMDNDQDKRAIFGCADLQKKAAILQELDIQETISLIENLEYAQVVEILQRMPSNVVTDIMGYLPQEVSEEILKLMEPQGSEVIEELLKYPEDTAGGIMTTEFCALQVDTTVEETIRKLQTELELDHIFYVYVVNHGGQLMGVLSLRKLLQAKPQTKIEEIMISDVIRVKADTDQEEVAKMVARYNLLALPVVDEDNKLMGIVMVDDIVDIMREEATEDILKMGGAGDVEISERSSFKSARSRLPWLFVSLLGGIVAFKVMSYFQVTLQSATILAFFVPLMMGMSGNVATQASTIVVSGLSTGKIRIKKIGWILWKELKVGLLFGVIYGLIVGAFANLQYGGTFHNLGLVVGGALVISMTLAAFIGSILPIVFEKFKIDPALSTGPFVTTIADIFGIFIYLYLAMFIHGVS